MAQRRYAALRRFIGAIGSTAIGQKSVRTYTLQAAAFENVTELRVISSLSSRYRSGVPRGCARGPAECQGHHYARYAAEDHAHAHQRADGPTRVGRPLHVDHQSEQQSNDTVEQD